MRIVILSAFAKSVWHRKISFTAKNASKYANSLEYWIFKFLIRIYVTDFKLLLLDDNIVTISEILNE